MPARKERQERLQKILQGFEGERSLKELFWQELEYDRVGRAIALRSPSKEVDEALAESPVLLAEAGDAGGFQVIYIRLDSEDLLVTRERAVVDHLLRSHPYALFVFSNSGQTAWHFVNVRSGANRNDEESSSSKQAKPARRRTLRRISVQPGDRLRTATERLSLIALGRLEEAADTSAPELAPLEIQSCHDEAFSVEAVTRAFYEDYLAVFEELKADMRAQSSAEDQRWAHKYALLFLNRCMFIHFVQRKGWLGGDTEFMQTFWHAYLDSEEEENSFFPRWLSVLFFDVFNGTELSGEHSHFPSGVRQALRKAPCLNGGLFRPGDLDEKRQGYGAQITDERLRQIFRFLGRYNFTIAEDSALDQEVAVDPEMIGKVYESLVNVSSEADERGEAGIFYTPRTEIDLMCRLSVVDFLSNHLGEDRKQLIRKFVFAVGPEEKRRADEKVSAAAGRGLWQRIRSLLREVTAVDPACGSGSFLVGMLKVLDDLMQRAGERLGADESAYDRRKRIIERSLYGVDVMDWAASVAELRLWLALITQANLLPDQLHHRTEPLLPNFTFKIRPGDALVQEVGGLSMGLRSGERKYELSQEVREQVRRFKTQKRKFFRNDPTGTYSSADELREAEVELFEDILRDGKSDLESKIERLDRQIAEPQARQMRLDGSAEPGNSQMNLRVEEWKEEKKALESQAAQIEETLGALRPDEPVPFVWDIAFIEVFSGEKQGFDIVIGNPPYVRQESIADPTGLSPGADVSRSQKNKYKDKLAKASYQAFPDFFGYDPSEARPNLKISKKSDLYIYFYFYGLRLLSPKGSFCFITSSSWMDVRYGKRLQEFMLRRLEVKYLIDSKVKRSFASADVNTVISLLSSPQQEIQDIAGSNARFVLLKTPFENTIEPELWNAVDEAENRKSASKYRVFPVSQKKLLREGAKKEVNGKGKSFEELAELVKYSGNKWGGKYLRAPDIYFDFVEAAGPNLGKLKEVATVRFGIKTGANAFFYLSSADVKEWGIKNKFLEPVLRSPREVKTVQVDPAVASNYLLICKHPKKKIKGTSLLDYIEWGEEQGYHDRASTRSRKLWYDVGTLIDDELFVPQRYRKRYVAGHNKGRLMLNKNLYGVSPKKKDDSREKVSPTYLLAWLNSCTAILLAEILGRTPGGGGGPVDLDVTMFKEMPFLAPSEALSKSDLEKLKDALKMLGSKPEHLHLSRAGLEVRGRLDEILFDLSDVSELKTEDVQSAVFDLSTSRVGKAASI